MKAKQPPLTLKPELKLSHRQILIFSGLTAVVGTVVVVAIFAAGPFAAVEPENGTLSGGATSLNVSGASGGKVVRFGTGATPTPTSTPAPTATPAPGQIPANTLPAGNDVGFLGDAAGLVLADATHVPSGLSYNSGGGYFELSGVSSKTFQNYRFTRPVKLSDTLPSNAGITITFKNNIFDIPGNQPYGGLTYQGTLGTNQIIVQDNTFRASSPLAGLYGNGQIQLDSRCTIQRNNVSGRGDGIQNGNGQCLIEQNYIHSPGNYGTYPNNTHNDGIQFYGGSGIQVRYNRIDIGWDGEHQNGALFFQGSFTGPVIDRNFISGGGFSLRLESGVSGAVVTNNTFKLPTISNPPWGPYTHSVQGGVTTWSGNVLTPGNSTVAK